MTDMKKRSADELANILCKWGFTSDDDGKWMDGTYIRLLVMQSLSDEIFNNTYEHKSKISRSYYGKTMNLKMKYILMNKIDEHTLRNVYCLLI